MPEDNIQCPYCSEFISVNDSKCPYCNESIDINSDVANLENQNLNNHDNKFYIGIIICIIFLLLIIAISITLFDKYNPSIEIFKDNVPIKESINFEKNNKINAENDIKNLQTAMGYFNAKDYDKAAEIYQQSIDEYNNPEAYYYMGEIYRIKGYTKLAIREYIQADSYKTNYYDAQKRLVQLYAKKGDINTAIQYGEKAMNSDLKDVELLESMFYLYKYNDNTEKMLLTCEYIVRIDSKHYNANYFLASYYVNEEKLREAIPYLQNLLNIRYDTDIAYSLAYIYSSIEYYTKAIEVLDKIVKNDSYEISRAEYLKQNISLLREEYRLKHNLNKL